MKINKPQIILGLSYFGMHDSSAVIIKDGKIIAASEEERWSRIKHDRSFPKKSIEYCLREAGVTINDIDCVGFFWKPWKGILKRMLYLIKGLPHSIKNLEKNGATYIDLLSAKKTFKKETGYEGPFHFLDHHLTHASSVFFSSGFEKSAIISVDGTGEKETCWIGKYDNGKFTQYQGVIWPHSIGHVYSAVTQFLGFKAFQDEYKVMGLSSFGNPVYLEDFRKIIISKTDGKFEIDLSYMSYQYGSAIKYSNQFIKKFGKNRKGDEPITQTHKDIASSLQKRLEEILLDLSTWTVRETGIENLCLTGGVSLNSKTIGILEESDIADNIYVSPVSGDSGTALGCAYLIDKVILKNQREKIGLPHAFWGPEYTDNEIEKALKQKRISYKIIENIGKVGAELIYDGKIIGWFQGRSEFGQRALGNRSILGDPRKMEVKERINSRIKRRESFRPFAPAVLEEFQKEYFEHTKPIPFMTEIHKIKPKKQKIIPAVSHIDGTARIQTVSKIGNPQFYNLIEEFHKLSGIPMVLNTSFNCNEPIVNTPEEAIETFLKTDLDNLIIGNYMISK